MLSGREFGSGCPRTSLLYCVVWVLFFLFFYSFSLIFIILSRCVDKCTDSVNAESCRALIQCRLRPLKKREKEREREAKKQRWIEIIWLLWWYGWCDSLRYYILYYSVWHADDDIAFTCTILDVIWMDRWT